MRTAGVVLAAGGGRRYGGPKALVEVDGERLVDRSVRLLHEVACDPILVVLGAWVGPVPGAEIVVNEQWTSGIASSLTAGLRRVTELDCDRALITLVDLPGLNAAAVRAVCATARGLATATFAGQPGHPVLISRPYWQPVMDTVSGDRGARDFFEVHASEVDEIELSEIANGDDLDFPSRTSAGPDDPAID